VHSRSNARKEWLLARFGHAISEEQHWRSNAGLEDKEDGA